MVCSSVTLNWMLSYAHYYAVVWGLCRGIFIYSKCHTRCRPTLIGSYIISENRLVKVLNIEQFINLNVRNSHTVSTEHVTSMYWNVCLLMFTITETYSELYIIECVVVFWLHDTLVLQHNGMAAIKCLASQAKSINLYKNLRTNVMKCCANIYLNQSALSRKSHLNTLT